MDGLTGSARAGRREENMAQVESRSSPSRVKTGIMLVLIAGFGATACQPGSLTGVLMEDGSSRDSGSALTGALYVQQGTSAHQQVAAWQSSRPQDASYLARIAQEAQAIWFGDWNGDIRSAVASVMSSSSRAGAIPVVVAYNIPHRDCGSYSAGGARDGAAYLGWIREFARGLQGQRSIVVLEPDAAAAADCLPPAQRSERLGLLADAVSILKEAGAAVYLDAGHAFWKTAAEMGPILRAAGIGAADGFALNVSNYHSTSANVRYGQALSRELGGARFVIDTSRNGVATATPEQWCNAPGQGLGERPRLAPGPAQVDAYLWVKRPGESDGTCNGGPAAGQWWAEYALELARRQPVSMAAGS
jgi:endoglucanase